MEISISAQSSLDFSTDEWLAERSEWIESMAYVLENERAEAAQQVFQDLYDYVTRRRAATPPMLGIPHRNTVSAETPPFYPGDIDLENRGLKPKSNTKV